jgi:hypothetical protein
MPGAPPPNSKLACTRMWPSGARCNWHGEHDDLKRIRIEKNGKREMVEACPRRRGLELTAACMAAGCWRRHRRVLDDGVKLCREHFAELTAIMHDEQRPLPERIAAAGALLHQEREQERDERSAAGTAEDGGRLN